MAALLSNFYHPASPGQRGAESLFAGNMSDLTKAWIKAEQKRGFVTAKIPVLLGSAAALLAIVQAFCAANLLALVLAAHHTLGAVAGFSAGFALCATIRAVLTLQSERLGFEAGAAARRRLRNGVLSTLLALGPAGLRGRHSAELASTAIDQVEAMEGFFARWIPTVFLAVIAPALIGLAALAADWRSGLILCVAGLLVPAAMAVAGIGAGLAAKKQFTAMQRLQMRFVDRIRGISTIVLAGRAEQESRALAAAARELRLRTMAVLRVAFLSSTALDLAAATALILIVFRFASILRGDFALAPTALFLLLLVPEFFAPLRAFAGVYQDRMAVEVVAEDFCALPSPPPQVPPAEIRTVAARGLALAFEDVSFAWAGVPVLEKLSFRVNAGEILLLTGASGAGKSTILDLILGFITPDSGKITINAAEMQSLVPSARTRIVAWIGQRPMLFNGTIEDNILFARPEASGAELDEAIRLARLTDFLSAFPQGAKTMIGEGGFGLSGGQAQRIAIARAFLKDAPLLLLDEPTAHLDPAVERDVLASLKRLAVGRAVILATHSAVAMEFARETKAKRLDLDALRLARLRGVA
jgi:ATP-binding cassette subfamily C protein CydD